MAERFNFNADMNQTANFRANDQDTFFVGHLLSLKLGKETLDKKSFKFRKPTAPTEYQEMAAVITGFEWSGDAGKPITIVGRVTDANASPLNDVIDKTDQTADCEVEFVIYRRKNAEEFFSTLASEEGTPIKGTIDLKNSEVSGYPMQDYTQTTNFQFKLVIQGARGDAQNICSDRGGNRKVPVPFGNVAPVPA